MVNYVYMCVYVYGKVILAYLEGITEIHKQSLV